MPMIDVYSTTGTFSDKNRLARDLARAVIRWEAVPEIPLFADNTAAFIHELPGEAISTAAGRSDYVRVQVLTPEGGWGIAGHANTQADIAAAARADLSAGD
jgi:hypothetical protein